MSVGSKKDLIRSLKNYDALSDTISEGHPMSATHWFSACKAFSELLLLAETASRFVRTRR